MLCRWNRIDGHWWTWTVMRDIWLHLWIFTPLVFYRTLFCNNLCQVHETNWRICELDNMQSTFHVLGKTLTYSRINSTDSVPFHIQSPCHFYRMGCFMSLAQFTHCHSVNLRLGLHGLCTTANAWAMFSDLSDGGSWDQSEAQVCKMARACRDFSCLHESLHS